MDINDVFLNDIKGEIERNRKNEEGLLICEIQESEKQYESYKSAMINEIRKLERLKNELRGFRTLYYDDEGIINNIKQIAEIKDVLDVRVRDRYIVVRVNNIIIEEPYTKKLYKMGNTTFYIPLTMSKEVRIKADKRVDGYSGDMSHPHIWREGDACYGSAEGQLVSAIINKDYFGAFITLLTFCRTVNIDDEAGWLVSYWDEVDKEGSVIREGHRPEADEYGDNGCRAGLVLCDSCGEYVYPEDMYECEDCGRRICNECMVVDIQSRYVCQSCYNNNYVTCDECGILLNENLDDGIINRVDGHIYCDDCFNEMQEEGEGF